MTDKVNVGFMSMQEIEEKIRKYSVEDLALRLEIKRT